jgi:hypothetical protein
MDSKPLSAFTRIIITVVIVNVALFTLPLTAFSARLLGMWRRGVIQYGDLARAVGHQFELRWLGTDKKADMSALDAADFSASPTCIKSLGMSTAFALSRST